MVESGTLESGCSCPRQMLSVLIMAQEGSEGNSAFDLTASQCVFSPINSGTKIFYCSSTKNNFMYRFISPPLFQKVFNVACLERTEADAKGKWSRGGDLAVITRLQVDLCPFRLIFMPSV